MQSSLLYISKPDPFFQLENKTELLLGMTSSSSGAYPWQSILQSLIIIFIEQVQSWSYLSLNKKILKI